MRSFHFCLLIAIVLLTEWTTADDVVGEEADVEPAKTERSLWEVQITDDGVFLTHRQLVIIVAVSAASFSFLATFFCLICCGYSCDFLLRCCSICRQRPEEKNKIHSGTLKRDTARPPSKKLAASLTSFQKNEFFEDCNPYAP